jgi:hypothetical protein
LSPVIPSVPAPSHLDAGYTFAADERPLFPGSLYTPRHDPWRRVLFALTALCTGLGITFANALTNVNVGSISGSLGLDVADASILPALYIGFNASANLTLVKARTQFGVPRVTLFFLAIYIAATLAQIVWPGLLGAAIVRAASGVAAAALTTLTIYFLLQIFPIKLRPLALVFGIGVPQLATPLARLVPVEWLANTHWRGLRLLEFGVALALFAIVAAVRLPPSDRSRAFTGVDVVVILFFVPACVLGCQVIGLGRVLWWTDTPWLGIASIAVVALFACGLMLETGRTRPLVHWRWIGTSAMLRFAGIALLLRLALAEQTYGSVGLLTATGLTNDQLHTLFTWVAVAMVAGVVTAALLLSEARIPWLIITAAAIIGAGALLDSRSNNLTRAHELYLSQALIGFGTTLFIGPAMVFGFLQLLRRGGGDFLITFIIVFSTSQNVGGLMGSALLGSFQTISARAHAGALSEHLIAGDPAVDGRIAAGAAALAGTVADPGARAAQGAGLLVQASNREAAFLAFDDVFLFVALLSVLAILIVLVARLWRGPPPAPS